MSCVFSQIVGPAGAVLKKLQQLTGTRITMPEKTDKSSKAKITGLKDQVKAAKAAIKSLLQDVSQEGNNHCASHHQSTKAQTCSFLISCVVAYACFSINRVSVP